MNTDEEMRQILTGYKTVASVGLSTNPAKESYGIVQYLISQGYDIIPVNPTADEILGIKAYPDLLSIPRKVDVVQVFRKPEDVPAVVEQAIQIGAKVVWMQVGVISMQGAAMARAAGLQVVMDHCMREEHRALIGQRIFPDMNL